MVGVDKYIIICLKYKFNRYAGLGRIIEENTVLS